MVTPVSKVSPRPMAKPARAPVRGRRATGGYFRPCHGRGEGETAGLRTVSVTTPRRRSPLPGRPPARPSSRRRFPPGRPPLFSDRAPGRSRGRVTDRMVAVRSGEHDRRAGAVARGDHGRPSSPRHLPPSMPCAPGGPVGPTDPTPRDRSGGLQWTPAGLHQLTSAKPWDRSSRSVASACARRSTRRC